MASNHASFKPGQSGNPNGRPKVAEEFRRKARKAVDEHVLNAWIDEVKERGKEWIRASENLAAYGYGKPTQPISDPDGNALQVVTHIYLPDNGRGGST